MFGGYGFKDTTFQVILDDGEPAVVTPGDNGVPVYHVFYASPLLENAMHRITFRNLSENGLIDYAIVGVENDTPLMGHNVIVGSDEAGIQYKGPWSRNSSTLRGVDGAFQRPFGNSTAQTGPKDASFRFQYHGTFISVVGVSPVKDCDSLWIFDDQPHSIRHVANMGQPDTYFEWFSMNSVFPGNHTLAFAGITGGLLTLDYIIYMPSTSTLEIHPNGTNVPGSGTSWRPTVTPTTISTTKKRLSNTGITGVVIAATAVSAATLLVLILLMRMKRLAMLARMKSIKQVEPYPMPELPLSDIVQHKSSTPGVSTGQAREGSIEAHYAMPDSSDAPSNGFWEGVHTVTGLLVVHEVLMDHTVEPFRSISYRVRQSYLMVRHKPSIPEAHGVPIINQRIQVIEAQDVGEGADDATSTTVRVVAQEGDARSRAEHLRRLMAEIQRELAESDSVTNAND
ncbi:hypothetical protein DXG01_005465 [Tephrocybe rancida]|nr:hypothetical protein DXG01_005465 [Tephrocybe rancida]